MVLVSGCLMMVKQLCKYGGTASCMRAFTGTGWMTNGAHGPACRLIRVGR